MLDAESLVAELHRSITVERRGRIVEALGTTLKVTGLDARVGQTCEIIDPSGACVPAEVVGLKGEAALLTLLGDMRGLSTSAEVIVRETEAVAYWGEALFGRILDARGRPIDGGAPLGEGLAQIPLYGASPSPMARARIAEPLPTGVRAIDSLLTIGRGQRVGVFAAAGGGKSTLLGMLARHAQADAIVIALIGERGREVREFVEDSLGADGLARSVVVCATSDRPAMERVRAAHQATAIAEGLRSQGRHVLLLMDSATRFARGLREIGLAAGEPAVRRGFPPSVFAELPRLFERAGTAETGSITAIYTVLVEDEETGDPIGEEVRSILDGHIILSRKLGASGHYPAIDVLSSLSRLFPLITTPEHRAGAARARSLLAKYADIEFLVQIGEYKAGGDPLADAAIAAKPDLDAFLRQDADTRADYAATEALVRSFAA